MRPLPQPGPDLGWVNRDILAKRLGWPAGALASCKRFDLRHPGWTTMWHEENTHAGFEHPAGFVATRGHGQTRCGVDLEALHQAVLTAPEDWPHWWHKVCCELRWLKS